MSCHVISSDEVRVKELTEKVRLFTDFALAHAEAEEQEKKARDARKAAGFCPCIDPVLEASKEKVSRLRDQALGF
jgi:hypothetical protein